jgi:DNA primase large subunit
MTILSIVRSFLNNNSCEDIIKDFFIGDAELFVHSSKEAVFIAQKIMELNENSSVEILRKADDKPIIALLLSLSLLKQYTNIVNKLIHKLSTTLLYDLIEYNDAYIVEYARALDMQLHFSERCFLETMYITVKNRKQFIMKVCYNYKIALTDYLKIAKPLLTEEPWKLISLPILEGYVYIDSKLRIARLLMEYLKNLLTSKLHQFSSQCTFLMNIKDFVQVLEDFKKILGLEKIEHFAISGNASTMLSTESLKETLEGIKSVNDLYNISKKLFPPCINSIIEALMKGENLSHHQRFALATFLINLGLTQEVIIELFKYSPDFNEKITKYQIEHLQGLRGSKKKYTTYNCDTMKVLNMCRYACGIKNPLQYPYKITKNRKS